MSSTVRSTMVLLGGLLIGACTTPPERDGWAVYLGGEAAVAYSPVSRGHRSEESVPAAFADEDLGRLTRDSDQGSVAEDCSAAGWLCLSGGWDFLVPTGPLPAEWTRGDISCRRLTETAPFRIMCDRTLRSGSTRTTTFAFVPARGVVAIQMEGGDMRHYRGCPILSSGC